MTSPLKRSVLGVAFAVVACSAWSPGCVTAVGQPATVAEIDGNVQDRTPNALVTEAKGRDPAVVHQASRSISVGPWRQATPSRRAAPAAAAVPTSVPIPSESALRSAGSMTASTDGAAPVSPASAPTRAEPEPTAPAAPPREPASRATPVPAASAEPAGLGPAEPPASLETLPGTTPTPGPPALPRPTLTAEEPAAAPPPGATTAGGDYRIGPEDLLDIAVWNNAAISRTVPVRPDGKISLPLLHDVQAAGLTPMQLREVLVKRLADYMPTPEVSVIVREVHSFKVSVLGEVKKPGQFELKSHSTVLDVIALAGGFTEFAARSRIVILRQAGATVKRVSFNYNNALSPDARQEDLFLQPGDVVVVP